MAILLNLVKKVGKGRLKGITIDQETVTERLSAFPIGAYIIMRHRLPSL